MLDKKYVLGIEAISILDLPAEFAHLQGMRRKCECVLESMRIQCIKFAGGNIADNYQISLIEPQSVVILVAGQKLALWSSPSGDKKWQASSLLIERFTIPIQQHSIDTCIGLLSSSGGLLVTCHGYSWMD